MSKINNQNEDKGKKTKKQKKRDILSLRKNKKNE